MGAWVAQSVKCPTLDFRSGHDLRVVRSSPVSGSTLGHRACSRFSLAHSPSIPSPLLSLPLKKKKKWRQGCPLSLSLINIILEVLANAIK